MGLNRVLPSSAELARRFPELTGIPIRQGYGMTEASPVTHMGFLDPARYRPESDNKYRTERAGKHNR